MTIEKRKVFLNDFRLCESIISYYSDKIADFQKKLGNEKLSFAHNNFRNEIERIKRTKEYESNILVLLNYCENDFEIELFQRRYIARQSYYEISCNICYTERTTFKFYETTFQRLAAKTKALPNIKF